MALPKIVASNSTDGNNTCCFAGTCLSPCPFGAGMTMPVPIALPMSPSAPSPIIVPARTYYERVEHHHPPLHKIREIIRRNRDRKRKKERYYESAPSDTDCSGTGGDTDTDIDTDSYSDSAIDYYDDVFHVNVRD